MLADRARLSRISWRANEAVECFFGVGENLSLRALSPLAPAFVVLSPLDSREPPALLALMPDFLTFFKQRDKRGTICDGTPSLRTGKILNLPIHKKLVYPVSTVFMKHIPCLAAILFSCFFFSACSPRWEVFEQTKAEIPSNSDIQGFWINDSPSYRMGWFPDFSLKGGLFIDTDGFAYDSNFNMKMKYNEGGHGYFGGYCSQYTIQRDRVLFKGLLSPGHEFKYSQGELVGRVRKYRKVKEVPESAKFILKMPEKFRIEKLLCGTWRQTSSDENPFVYPENPKKVKFKESGLVLSPGLFRWYVTDKYGNTRQTHESRRAELTGDEITVKPEFRNEKEAVFSYSLEGDTLTLTVKTSPSAADIGRVIHLKRREEIYGLPPYDEISRIHFCCDEDVEKLNGNWIPENGNEFYFHADEAPSRSGWVIWNEYSNRSTECVFFNFDSPTATIYFNLSRESGALHTSKSYHLHNGILTFGTRESPEKSGDVKFEVKIEKDKLFLKNADERFRDYPVFASEESTEIKKDYGRVFTFHRTFDKPPK